MGNALCAQVLEPRAWEDAGSPPPSQHLHDAVLSARSVQNTLVYDLLLEDHVRAGIWQVLCQWLIDGGFVGHTSQADLDRSARVAVDYATACLQLDREQRSAVRGSDVGRLLAATAQSLRSWMDGTCELALERWCALGLSSQNWSDSLRGVFDLLCVSVRRSLDELRRSALVDLDGAGEWVAKIPEAFERLVSDAGLDGEQLRCLSMDSGATVFESMVLGDWWCRGGWAPPWSASPTQAPEQLIKDAISAPPVPVRCPCAVASWRLHSADEKLDKWGGVAFQRHCLVKAFWSCGVEVLPPDHDGPLWALRDGNRLLAPHGWTLAPVPRDTVRSKGTYVLHRDAHFRALVVTDFAAELFDDDAVSSLTRGELADISVDPATSVFKLQKADRDRYAAGMWVPPWYKLLDAFGAAGKKEIDVDESDPEDPPIDDEAVFAPSGGEDLFAAGGEEDGQPAQNAGLQPAIGDEMRVNDFDDDADDCGGCATTQPDECESAGELSGSPVGDGQPWGVALRGGVFELDATPPRRQPAADHIAEPRQAADLVAHGGGGSIDSGSGPSLDVTVQPAGPTPEGASPTEAPPQVRPASPVTISSDDEASVARSGCGAIAAAFRKGAARDEQGGSLHRRLVGHTGAQHQPVARWDFQSTHRIWPNGTSAEVVWPNVVFGDGFDKKLLESEYRKLVAKRHPDKVRAAAREAAMADLHYLQNLWNACRKQGANLLADGPRAEKQAWVEIEDRAGPPEKLVGEIVWEKRYEKIEVGGMLQAFQTYQARPPGM